jgi:hypothetical protein
MHPPPLRFGKNPAGGIHHICWSTIWPRVTVTMAARGVLGTYAKIGVHGKPVLFTQGFQLFCWSSSKCNFSLLRKRYAMTNTCISYNYFHPLKQCRTRYAIHAHQPSAEAQAEDRLVLGDLGLG